MCFILLCVCLFLSCCSCCCLIMTKWSWPIWTASSSSRIKQGSAKWRRQSTHWGEGHTLDLFQALCSNCLQLFSFHQLSSTLWHALYLEEERRVEHLVNMTYHIIPIRCQFTIKWYWMWSKITSHVFNIILTSHWPAGISIQMLYLRRTITTSLLWTTSHISWTASGEWVLTHRL